MSVPLAAAAQRMRAARIHPTADVSPLAQIGCNTRIWHGCQVREGARIGDNCILGKDVYVDHHVIIGSNVKIQNGAQLYHGLTVEDGVFIGPRVCFTNDRRPRAITPDGRLKGIDDWHVLATTVRYGASLGAGAIVLPGLVIGRFAMVAAGAVVTADVAEQSLVIGVPAHFAGYVCRCGEKLEAIGPQQWICRACGRIHWSVAAAPVMGG